MTAQTDNTFFARVNTVLLELHPSERKLADLVLDFPGEMAGYTATEIAQLADVSNATVSRFVRRLGYGSFDEARRAVRDEQRAGMALFRFRSEQVATDGIVAAHHQTTLSNLERTYDFLEDAEIESLAQALLGAPRVWFVGFRAGQPFALYLGWQISQVLPNVTVLPRAGETLAESMASVTAQDVVVLIALRRKPSVVSAVAKVALDRNAGLAVLEDRPSEDLAQAQWRLTCATSANGPLTNHVSTMAVCNLIAARTIELSGTKGRRRMAEIEKCHRGFNEL
ncbi:MAG: MurR/RpiR family transcriptional regulator [Silicimonas sp.]|nr:MurR/RpiR family transcriptional regulator [Silicimonas sp.]